MKQCSRGWLIGGLILLSIAVLSVCPAAPAAQAADPTPSPTPAHFVWLPLILRDSSAVPTPFPTASPTWTASATATTTATATVSQTPTETATPVEGTSTPTPTPTVSPTETATSTFTVSPTATLTPTASQTPTATPTPTNTPCSTTNVTGTYYAQVTNMVNHGCPITPATPAPGDIGVIQSGSSLTLRTGGGTATGTINPVTGAFTVSGTLSSAGGCPTGATCINTTTGTFALGQNPMSFSGTGRIDVSVFGIPYCYITYDTSGTRTSCAMPAARSDNGWTRVMDWLREWPGG